MPAARIFCPFRTLSLVLLCLLLAACSEETPVQGIVARVNGTPIYLDTVQTLQDTRTVSLGAAQRPSVELLKRQYGVSLSILIMHTLVMQELDRLDLAVPEELLKAAEAEVRADYPENEFEKTLTEEYIDINVWRNLLRQQLSMTTFQNKVLRPQLSVPLEEAEKYYQANKNEFIIPASISLIQVSGTNRQSVEEARTKGPKLENDSIPDLTVQRFTIRRKSVPAVWQKDVEALTLEQSSPVKSRDGYYQFVILVGVHPQKEMTFMDAYPLISDMLLEEKIDASFNQWLEQAIKSARIQVAEHLIPELTDKSPLPAQRAEPADSTPMKKEEKQPNTSKEENTNTQKVEKKR